VSHVIRFWKMTIIMRFVIIDKYYQRTVNILDYKRVIIKRYDCNRITEYNFTLFNDRLFITIDWNRNLFEIYFDSQLDTLTVEEIGLNNNIITLKFTNTETNKSITSNFLSPCDLKDTIEQTKLLKEFKLYAKSEEIYWDYVKKLEYYPSLVPDVDDLFNLSTNLALGKKQQLKFERQD